MGRRINPGGQSVFCRIAAENVSKPPYGCVECRVQRGQRVVGAGRHGSKRVSV